MATTTDTSTLFSENTLDPVDDNFFLPYGTALVAFSILACLCCCCGLPVPWVIFGVRVAGASRNNVGCGEMTLMVLSYLCGGFVPVCCLCVGCIMVAVYAGMLASITSIDYYGLMRTTQVGSDRTGPHEESSSGRGHQDQVTAYFQVSPYLQVEFGYEWACGGDVGLGFKYCDDATAYVGDCKVEACTRTTKRRDLQSVTCTDEEFQTAEAAAENCVAQLYFGVETPSEIPAYTFDPTIGPSRDNVTAAPPSLYLYGDCNSCEAKFDIGSVDTAQDLRLTGGLLCLVGLVTVLFSSCITVCYCSKGKFGRERDVVPPQEGPAMTTPTANSQPVVATAVPAVPTPPLAVPATAPVATTSDPVATTAPTITLTAAETGTSTGPIVSSK